MSYFIGELQSQAKLQSSDFGSDSFLKDFVDLTPRFEDDPFSNLHGSESSESPLGSIDTTSRRTSNSELPHTNLAEDTFQFHESSSAMEDMICDPEVTMGPEDFLNFCNPEFEVDGSLDEDQKTFTDLLIQTNFEYENGDLYLDTVAFDFSTTENQVLGANSNRFQEVSNYQQAETAVRPGILFSFMDGNQFQDDFSFNNSELSNQAKISMDFGNIPTTSFDEEVHNDNQETAALAYADQETDPISEMIKKQIESHTNPFNVYFKEKSNTSREAGYKGKTVKLQEPKIVLVYNGEPIKEVILPQNRAAQPTQNTIIMSKEADRPTVSRIRYIRSENFMVTFDDPRFELRPYESSNDNIYEPQFYRVQVVTEETKSGIKTKLPINHTRCGLCPFCDEIRFFEFRNSAYGQHLAFHHGIGTDSYLTPDPFPRPHSPKSKHKFVTCPACYDTVPVAKSSTTVKEQPLYTYLRHFKDCHRKGVIKNKDGTVSLSPLSFKLMKLQKLEQVPLL